MHNLVLISMKALLIVARNYNLYLNFSNGIISLASKNGIKCKYCKFSPKNLEVTCRVCDVKIKKPEACPNSMSFSLIEKHLDSDEHTQKQQVFNLYHRYSEIRRFDLEKELKMENLKFFDCVEIQQGS